MNKKYLIYLTIGLSILALVIAIPLYLFNNGKKTNTLPTQIETPEITITENNPQQIETPKVTIIEEDPSVEAPKEIGITEMPTGAKERITSKLGVLYAQYNEKTNGYKLPSSPSKYIYLTHPSEYKSNSKIDRSGFIEKEGGIIVGKLTLDINSAILEVSYSTMYPSGATPGDECFLEVNKNPTLATVKNAEGTFYRINLSLAKHSYDEGEENGSDVYEKDEEMKKYESYAYFPKVDAKVSKEFCDGKEYYSYTHFDISMIVKVPRTFNKDQKESVLKIADEIMKSYDIK